MRHLKAASYLFKDRFGTYYFRFSVPKNLRIQRPTLPREIRRSLNTKEEMEAIPKARLLWLKLTGELGLLPMNTFNFGTISSGEKYLATASVSYCRDDSEEAFMRRRLSASGFGELADGIESVDELRDFYSRVRQIDDDLKQSILTNDQVIRNHLLKQRGIEVSVSQPLQIDGAGSSTASSERPVAITDTTLLSVRIAEFIDRNRRSWEENNLKEVQSLLRIFVEIIGDKPLHSLTVNDANKFFDMIQYLPRNYVLLSRRTKENLSQLVAKVKTGELAGLRPGAQVKYVRRAAQFLEEARLRGEYSQENFFRRRLIRQKQKEKTNRDYFKKEALTAILTGYRGFTDVRGGRTFAPRFWIPLIALYTGARLNEICQLHVTDVIEEEGISSLVISHSKNVEDRENSKRVKTKASQRKFPIHKTLLELGFLNFVAQRKSEKSKRLFPELPYNGKNGHGNKVSGWFNAKFLPKIGVKTERLCFHSFRNTFVTKFKGGGGKVEVRIPLD